MRCIHEVRGRRGSMALVWLPSQKTRQDFQQGPTVQSFFLGKWKQNAPWPGGGSPYSCQAKIKHLSQRQHRPRLALQMSVLVVLFLFYSSIGPSGLEFVERVERKSSFIELVLKRGAKGNIYTSVVQYFPLNKRLPFSSHSHQSLLLGCQPASSHQTLCLPHVGVQEQWSCNGTLMLGWHFASTEQSMPTRLLTSAVSNSHLTYCSNFYFAIP